MVKIQACGQTCSSVLTCQTVDTESKKTFVFAAKNSFNDRLKDPRGT